MKTYLVYGFAMALASALLTLSLYLLGFHSDPTKFGPAQGIAAIAGIVIAVVCIVLGTKARRAEVPATENFGYGSALGAGVMITLFSALFGIVTTYLYFQVINPGFNELMMQVQVEKMEAKGMSGQQLEQAEAIMRKMMSPAMQCVWAFIGSVFFGTIISLITAAFLKRRANDQPPIVA